MTKNEPVVLMREHFALLFEQILLAHEHFALLREPPVLAHQPAVPAREHGGAARQHAGVTREHTGIRREPPSPAFWSTGIMFAAAGGVCCPDWLAFDSVCGVGGRDGIAARAQR